MRALKIHPGVMPAHLTHYLPGMRSWEVPWWVIRQTAKAFFPPASRGGKHTGTKHTQFKCMWIVHVAWRAEVGREGQEDAGFSLLAFWNITWTFHLWDQRHTVPLLRLAFLLPFSDQLYFPHCHTIFLRWKSKQSTVKDGKTGNDNVSRAQY